MPTAKLLKVIVQAVYVIEAENGDLTEEVAKAVAVPAPDWPTFPKTFKGLDAAIQAEVAAREPEQK